MSFGAGHIFDMINRIKDNQALKKKRKGYFDREGIYTRSDRATKTIASREITEEEREQTEIMIRAYKKRERTRIVKTIILGILITIGFFYILYMYLSWVFM